MVAMFFLIRKKFKKKKKNPSKFGLSGVTQGMRSWPCPKYCYLNHKEGDAQSNKTFYFLKFKYIFYRPSGLPL
jgi:hypothetical protein